MPTDPMAANQATDVTTLAGIDAANAARRREGAVPSRKIRVLHVLTVGVRGGIEENVLSLLRHLDRNKFSPALACPAPLIKAYGNDLRELDVSVHVLPPMSRPYHFGGMIRLARLLKHLSPDVVHTHLFVATLCVAPVAKLCRVPVVIETCEVREAWRRGIWKRYWIDRQISRFVDANIAVSESLRRYLVDEKRLPPEKVVVIRNGRELSRVVAISGRDLNGLRNEFRVRPGELIVSLLGRLEVQKGHAYLLEALPKVLPQFPGLRVLVVGDGSLRDALAAEINRRELGDHVLLTGYRRDVYDILRISDLVVLPSLWEGLPLTAIEAGALGKPILATSVDGTPEIVLHGETGWLVPPGDSSALAEAMIRLLGDSEIRARMGTRARDYVIQNFSFNRVVTEIEELYIHLSCALMKR